MGGQRKVKTMDEKLNNAELAFYIVDGILDKVEQVYGLTVLDDDMQVLADYVQEILDNQNDL